MDYSDLTIKSSFANRNVIGLEVSHAIDVHTKMLHGKGTQKAVEVGLGAIVCVCRVGSKEKLKWKE